MSGFSIYETLRIFVPGAIAMLILDVTLRLATGVSATDVGEGGAASLVDAIETPATFALLALVGGLLLYLVDLPERLRIAKGDKTRDVPRPSESMKAILCQYNKSAKAEERYDQSRYLSLFFLFSDHDIPDDLRTRIYLFGSLFKIYVDLRVLLVSALVLGVPASIAYAGDGTSARPQLSTDGAAVFTVGGIALVICILGFAGQKTFSRGERRFLQRTEGASTAGTGYAEVLIPAVVLLALMATSVWVAATVDGLPQSLAMVSAAAALAIWFALEIGPPEAAGEEAAPSPPADERATSGWSPFRDSLREKLLQLLRVESRHAPQLPIWFRTVTDLALMVPALAGASVAAVYLGREPSSLLAWSVLALPAVLIMTVRKHESRQIGAFHHQLAYLDLFEKRIKSRLKDRQGFGD